jgi:hypothetical protein
VSVLSLVSLRTGYSRAVIDRLCCVECVFPSPDDPGNKGRFLFPR